VIDDINSVATNDEWSDNDEEESGQYLSDGLIRQKQAEGLKRFAERKNIKKSEDGEVPKVLKTSLDKIIEAYYAVNPAQRCKEEDFKKANLTLRDVISAKRLARSNKLIREQQGQELKRLSNIRDQIRYT